MELRRFFLTAAAAVLFAAHGVLLAAETAIPALTQPVVDTANILDPAVQDSLNEQIRAYYNAQGTQLAVLTVPSIGDESIDEYGIRVAKAWKLGQQKLNNGVLLVVALQERKIRIDVGYGLEGTLTDTKCGIIIREFISPQFAKEDYAAGIQNGITAIIGILDGDEALEAQIKAYQSKKSDGSRVGLYLPLGIFLAFLALAITDANGLGPFGFYWWKAVLTGQPFVRKKRTPVAAQSFAGSDDSGSSDDGASDAGSASGSDDYSGDGGDFGGGGASGSW